MDAHAGHKQPAEMCLAHVADLCQFTDLQGPVTKISDIFQCPGNLCKFCFFRFSLHFFSRDQLLIEPRQFNDERFLQPAHRFAVQFTVFLHFFKNLTDQDKKARLLLF